MTDHRRPNPKTKGRGRKPTRPSKQLGISLPAEALQELTEIVAHLVRTNQRGYTCTRSSAIRQLIAEKHYKLFGEDGTPGRNPEGK